MFAFFFTSRSDNDWHTVLLTFSLVHPHCICIDHERNYALRFPESDRQLASSRLCRRSYFELSRHKSLFEYISSEWNCACKNRTPSSSSRTTSKWRSSALSLIMTRLLSHSTAREGFSCRLPNNDAEAIRHLLEKRMREKCSFVASIQKLLFPPY